MLAIQDLFATGNRTFTRCVNVVLLCMLSACGGGESSVKLGGFNQGNFERPMSVSGFVGDQSPWVGALIEFQCRDGLGRALTDGSGRYTTTLNMDGFPCMARATSADGKTVLHGFATDGISVREVNVLPLTELILASAGGADPAQIFAAFAVDGGKSMPWLTGVGATDVAQQTLQVAINGALDTFSARYSIERFVAGGQIDLAQRQLQSILSARSWTFEQLRQKLLDGGAQEDMEGALVAGLTVRDEGGFDEFWAEHFAVVPNAGGISVVKSVASPAAKAKVIEQSALVYDPLTGNYQGADSAACGESPRALLNPLTDAVVAIPSVSSPCLLDFYAGSNYSPPSGDSRYRLITLNLGDKNVVRFQLGSLVRKSLAGQEFASVLNSKALGSTTGRFGSGAYAYTAELFNLDDVFVLEAPRVDANSYVSTKEFSTAYTDQLLCGIWPKSAEGQSYGVTFDAADDAAARLWPLLDGACSVVPGSTPTALTVIRQSDFPKELALRPPQNLPLPASGDHSGGVAIDFGAPSPGDGPAAGSVSAAQLQSTLTSLGVGVNSSYVVGCSVGDAGHVFSYTVFYALNRFSMAPSSGVFLNRTALNDVLRGAGQSEFPQ